VQGERGELGPDEALAVIDRLADAGVFMLTLSGGEVTLRPDLLALVLRARERGLAVTLFTNGFKLTSELAGQLREADVWRLEISLYGADSVTHESITNVPGSFERTLQGIRNARAAGLSVVVKASMLAENSTSISRIGELAASLGCGFQFTDEIDPREDGDLGPVRLRPAVSQRVEQSASSHEAVDYSAESIERARHGVHCRVGSVGLVVEANGELKPCVSLAVPLGNVLVDAPNEVLSAADATFMRSINIQTLHGCRDCDLVPGCHRCHGSAARETGDALGPYPSACERALAYYERSVGATPLIRSSQAAPRPPGLGPFKIVRHGVLRQVADEATPEDEALARKFPWIRPREWQPPVPQLVQLRSKAG
jgi:radical SAM protein with 4Fe4S-binding SPASM domain